MIEEVQKLKNFKVKYPILKKDGYKLEYSDKSENYLDIFLSKKVDDVISIKIHMTEKRITKRIESPGSDYNKLESFTHSEILGIAEIISQIS